MPISRVRCATASAITPYTPMVESTSASSPRLEARRPANRWGRTPSSVKRPRSMTRDSEMLGSSVRRPRCVSRMTKAGSALDRITRLFGWVRLPRLPRP
jgi:hypothetical protein